MDEMLVLDVANRRCLYEYSKSRIYPPHWNVPPGRHFTQQLISSLYAFQYELNVDFGSQELAISEIQLGSIHKDR
jgi:hypothetical protein